MNKYITKKVLLGDVISEVRFNKDDIGLVLACNLEAEVVVDREFCAINQPNRGDFYILDKELNKAYVISKEKFMEGDYEFAGCE